MSYFIKSILALLFVLVLAIIILRKTNALKKEDFSVFVFFISTLFLIYLEGVVYIDYKKFLISLGLYIIIWIFSVILSNSRKVSELRKNDVYNQICLIAVSFVSVITQIVYYMFFDFYGEIYNYNKRQLIYILILIIIFMGIFKIMLDTRIVDNFFNIKDKKRNVFIISEVIFALLFIVESIFTIININNFKFIN